MNVNANEKDMEIVKKKMDLKEVKSLLLAANASPYDSEGDFNENYPDQYDYAHERFDELGFSSWFGMKDALLSVIKAEREKEVKKWREQMFSQRLLKVLS